MNEFDSLNHGLYSSPLAGLFGMPAMSFPSLEPTSFDDNRGGWTSESFMTTTVNGVTQTIHKRRDWDVRVLCFHQLPTSFKHFAGH
jgi:DnaJ family protein B protein 6